MNLNLGILASGRGSNAMAIVQAIKDKKLDAMVQVIISNNPSAGVLDYADSEGISHCCINRRNSVDETESILEMLTKHDVNLVLLAGYMKPINQPILDAYNNRILNIHPSLLPKHGGKGMYGIRVHEAVIASDDTETGVTIHMVNEEYDEGRILAQYKVPRFLSDTPVILAARVLGVEHVIYFQTLRDIQQGIIRI